LTGDGGGDSRTADILPREDNVRTVSKVRLEAAARRIEAVLPDFWRGVFRRIDLDAAKRAFPDFHPAVSLFLPYDSDPRATDGHYPKVSLADVSVGQDRQDPRGRGVDLNVRALGTSRNGTAATATTATTARTSPALNQSFEALDVLEQRYVQLVTGQQLGEKGRSARESFAVTVKNAKDKCGDNWKVALHSVGMLKFLLNNPYEAKKSFKSVFSKSDSNVGHEELFCKVVEAVVKLHTKSVTFDNVEDILLVPQIVDFFVRVAKHAGTPSEKDAAKAIEACQFDFAVVVTREQKREMDQADNEAAHLAALAALDDGDDPSTSPKRSRSN